MDPCPHSPSVVCCWRRLRGAAVGSCSCTTRAPHRRRRGSGARRAPRCGGTRLRRRPTRTSSGWRGTSRGGGGRRAHRRRRRARPGAPRRAPGVGGRRRPRGRGWGHEPRRARGGSIRQVREHDAHAPASQGAGRRAELAAAPARGSDPPDPLRVQRQGAGRDSAQDARRRTAWRTCGCRSSAARRT